MLPDSITETQTFLNGSKQYKYNLRGEARGISKDTVLDFLKGLDFWQRCAPIKYLK